MDPYQCIYHKGNVDKESEEHIIPSALGGVKKSRRISTTTSVHAADGDAVCCGNI